MKLKESIKRMAKAREDVDGKHKGKGQEKVHTVMSEFKHGSLHSGSGGKVTDRKQAIAIALSEAGLSKKKRG